MASTRDNPIDVIERIVDDRILFSPYFGKLRTDVDRLQKDSLDYELQVDECRQAIKDLEDINSAQMKKINRALKGMERTLETLYQRQSEAGYEPLQEEVVAMKARGEHLVKGTTSQQHPGVSPDTYPPSLNTLQSHAEEPILNTGSLLVSQESSSPLPSLTPSPLPSPSPLPPSLPLEETHDIISPPQVTGETDTTAQVVPFQTTRLLLEPLSTNSGRTIGSGPIPVLYIKRPSYHALFRFVLWLTQWVEAGNAYLEVCLDCGGRHTGTLLNKIFTLHPLLFRAFLIVESALLSLHPAVLLLTCMLYIQEAVLLASRMEPAIVA